uniref:TM protein n=1 Tax=Jeilongvirus sp. TaxID=2686070 RepID=A0A8F7CGK4_9MONO|nr:TM protein [Jeilongvirus sp.]
MTTDYEEPNSIPSGYGSLSSRSPVYKASQVRGASYYTRSRPIRRLGHVSRSNGNTLIYFVFTIILCAFNLAATCYLIVTTENKVTSCVSPPRGPKLEGGIGVTEQLDHMASSINTMMTALTYTLPQVLNTNKLSLQAQLNHMASEIREIIKLNSLELDVKLALNRTIQLRTGHKQLQKTNWTRAPTRPPPTFAPRYRDITLVPRRFPVTRDNIPMTRVLDPDDIPIGRGVPGVNPMRGGTTRSNVGSDMGDYPPVF